MQIVDEKSKAWKMPRDGMTLGWISLLAECDDAVWMETKWLDAELGRVLLEQEEKRLRREAEPYKNSDQ